jgi:hypothetical protein
MPSSCPPGDIFSVGTILLYGSSGAKVQIVLKAKRHSGSARRITIEASRGASKTPPRFKIRLNRMYSKHTSISFATPRVFLVSYSSAKPQSNEASRAAGLTDFFYAENESVKQYLNGSEKEREKQSFLTELHRIGENKWKRWHTDLKIWTPETRVLHRKYAEKRIRERNLGAWRLYKTWTGFSRDPYLNSLTLVPTHLPLFELEAVSDDFSPLKLQLTQPKLRVSLGIDPACTVYRSLRVDHFWIRDW